MSIIADERIVTEHRQKDNKLLKPEVKSKIKKHNLECSDSEFEALKTVLADIRKEKLKVTIF